MTLRIAFVLKRANWLRTLGPIIEAASQAPDIDPVIAILPEREKEPPDPGTLAKFRVPISLGMPQADAIVTTVGRTFLPEEGGAHALWCAVFDQRHSTTPAHGYHVADLTFWPSETYYQMALENGVIIPREKAKIVGYARLDALKSIDPAEVRKRNGIPPGPVVLVIPDAYLFGKLTPLPYNALYDRVWTQESLAKRLFGALVHVRTPRAIGAALSPKFSYSAILKAIRGFCLNNHAQLVFAPRRNKEWSERPYTDSEFKVADGFLAPHPYPDPILQGVSIADLVICLYRSSAVLEAIGAGKPYITLDMPAETLTEFEASHTKGLDDFRARLLGAAWLLEPDWLIREFPKSRFEDFQIREAALNQYAQKHLGPLDRQASLRILQEIRARLKS